MADNIEEVRRVLMGRLMNAEAFITITHNGTKIELGSHWPIGGTRDAVRAMLTMLLAMLDNEDENGLAQMVQQINASSKLN